MSRKFPSRSQRRQHDMTGNPLTTWAKPYQMGNIAVLMLELLKLPLQGRLGRRATIQWEDNQWRTCTASSDLAERKIILTLVTFSP
jgi:hypothetical protein